MSEEIEYQISKPKDPEINFQCDGKWLMKIGEGKIKFNREEFPDLCEDEFAYKVLKILEEINVITIDQSSWDHERISNDESKYDRGAINGI